MDLGELAAQLEGRLLTRPNELDAYRRDFSGLDSVRPAAVARCRDSEDITATLRFARMHGIAVTVRAGGRSGRGQSLGRGIVLVGPSGRPSVLADDTIEVDAAARWADVQAMLGQLGRSAPVLPADLDTSVGGTLAVGGYGVRSVGRGNQLDHVLRVRLIGADGRAEWLSRETDRELFSLALGSLGQLGVLDRVVLATAPREPVALSCTVHESFASLADSVIGSAAGLDALFAFAGRPEYLSRRIRLYRGVGVGRGGAAVQRAGSGRDAPGATAIDAPRDIDVSVDHDVRGWLASFPGRRRLFTDLVLGGEGLARLCRWLDAAARSAQDLHGVYLLASRNRAGFPFDGRCGDDELVYGIGLYCLVGADRPDRQAAAEALLAEAIERCLDAGGRLYLWGWHHLAEDELEAVYGEPYRRLRALRSQRDPDGVLNRWALVGRRRLAPTAGGPAW